MIFQIETIYELLHHKFVYPLGEIDPEIKIKVPLSIIQAVIFSGKKSYWMILSPVLRLEGGRDLINQHATELRAVLKEQRFPEGDIFDRQEKRLNECYGYIAKSYL